MTRANLHGLLLIDKPGGMTSHDVVHKARKALGISQVGHGGTLDPMATGLLVLLLGEATKLSDHVLTGDKGYELKVKLGLETDTLDVTGQVLRQQEVQLDPDKIAFEARQLVGEFQWPVPIFSAVKVAGKKLYAYAHNQERVESTPVKTMRFWDVELRGVTSDSVSLAVQCSKGSYIRTWAAELGQKLGVGGALAELRRVYSAPYSIKNALSFEAIRSARDEHEEAWKNAFVPLENILHGWPTYSIRGKDERLIHNGQISHELERRLIVESKKAIEAQKTVGIQILSAESGQLLALIEAFPDRKLKIKRVFKMT